MNDLTWPCHICNEERPDAKISVLTKPLNIPGVIANENIRYCNDKEECIEGAKTFSFYKYSEEGTTDWLSAIEYEVFELPIVLCKNCERMIPVLREVIEKLEACTNITGVVPNLSDDAKALLKAKREDNDRDNN